MFYWHVIRHTVSEYIKLLFHRMKQHGILIPRDTLVLRVVFPYHRHCHRKEFLLALETALHIIILCFFDLALHCFDIVLGEEKCNVIEKLCIRVFYELVGYAPLAATFNMFLDIYDIFARGKMTIGELGHTRRGTYAIDLIQEPREILCVHTVHTIDDTCPLSGTMLELDNAKNICHKKVTIVFFIFQTCCHFPELYI